MTPPDMAEIISRAIASQISDVYTSEIGVIQSYNSATRTAEVRILVDRAVPTDDPLLPYIYEEMPILPDVPVTFPRGAGSRITWKLAPGDTGLVMILRSSIAAWRQSGEVPSRPKDVRTHHPAHAVFLAGATLVPDATSEPGTDEDAVIIESPMTKVGFDATDFVALATLVNQNFSDLQTWLGTHTHAAALITHTGVPETSPPSPGDVSATKLKAK